MPSREVAPACLLYLYGLIYILADELCEFISRMHTCLVTYLQIKSPLDVVQAGDHLWKLVIQLSWAPIFLFGLSIASW